jgi:peptide/nickel transport system substrate-binding protein
LLVVTVLALLLAACAPAPAPAPAQAPEPTKAPAAATKAPEPTKAPAAPAAAPKVLIVASGQDISNLDPHTGDGYSNRAMHRNVYDPLVRYEGNPSKIVPNLAESWTISPDGLEYTFKLVKDAKFHDGSPVTADAVKYSFNRSLKLKKGGNWMFASAMDENSTSVVDANTVKIKLTKPFAPFLSVLPWMFVVNPKIVDANLGSDDGQTWLKDHDAGSGPFMVKRWEPGTLYEIERFSGYWKKGGGNLTGAIWKITRETSSQRLAVQKGDAHIAVDLTGDDMDFLKGSQGVVLVEQPEFRTFSIKLNYQNGPLADPALRKAVSYAFDYDAMLEAEGAGHAVLMRGPLPPGILGADPNLDVPRMDLAKAKEWLAKSQSPNGGIKLTYVYVSGLEIERKLGLILLDSLKKLNIELDVKQLVWPDMVALTKDPKTTPDFFPVFQTANYADPDNIAYAAYHGSQTGNWSNPTYKSAKTDELIEKGRTTLAEADRIKIYGDLQKQIVDDAPDIFGVLENRKLAMRDSVQGWEFVPIASNAIEFFPLSLK